MANGTMTTTTPWNGQFEEGDVASPGYTTRLGYVIQRAETPEGASAPGFVWVLLAGTAQHEVASGEALTLAQARVDLFLRAAQGRQR